MQQPKVSVITACYNGARFIDDWADSLLRQTWNNVEIFFVNDGSTDDSEERFFAVRPKLEARGFTVGYTRQENQGIGPATNVGLRKMSGDYFMIYDVDDLLEPECFAHRVAFLEVHPDCSLLLTDGWCAYDGAMDVRYPHQHLSPHLVSMEQEEEWIFEKVLLGERGSATQAYMYRTRHYLEANPSRTIYPSPYFQDEMLVLLNSYHYKCGFLPERLFTQRINPQSHSKTHVDQYDYYEGMRDANFATIDQLDIPASQKAKYKGIIQQKSSRKLNLLLLEQMRQNSFLPKEIVIFGAGKVGRDVVRLAERSGIRVKYAIDNDFQNRGGYLGNGIDVRDPEAVKGQLKDVLTVVAVLGVQKELVRQLESYGLVRDVDYLLYKDFMKFCRVRETLALLEMECV